MLVKLLSSVILCIFNKLPRGCEVMFTAPGFPGVMAFGVMFAAESFSVSDPLFNRWTMNICTCSCQFGSLKRGYLKPSSGLPVVSV